MNIATSESSDIPASLPSINDSAVALSSASAPDIVQEEQPENQAGRPPRTHRLPLRFRDELPVPPPAIPVPASTNVVRRVVLYVFDSFRTSLNQFGIGREYRHRPSYDPDAFISVEQLSNITSNLPSLDEQDSTDHSRIPEVPSQSPPWPWRSMSIWRLMSWKMTSNSGLTSESQLTRLVREVLKAKDFSLDDVPDDFNAHTEMTRFDVSEATLDANGIFQRDSWRESVAEILVPTRERNTAGNGQLFTVPGFHYRPLVAVIRAAFSEASSRWFHLTPFKRFWKSPLTGREQRLYDELYTSDAWNKAHDELQKQKRDDGCQLERVIAGLMFWSNATHLAQFGNASAWPVYLFFGNQSKYVRACPTTNACHPIAFIPSVSLHPSHQTISEYPNTICL
ncbi:uncharacterized protein F5147DRAFT_583689 [Suillus discolor]|uniref:Uncharacterized protein n=1 Tax=Suillus discolor TaxID=1912936 RepID=A0A9P7EZV4_9AGAM|nr:uncharacterized protein F5147DRAFT_583689 [Suillus discolor]KAG2097224.1 hypothetical protein F5147DRAFT_583689 [Suillus discolor]